MTAHFAYGAELGRFRQDKSSGETIFYVDKLMEVVQVGTSADYRHYLGEVAVLTKTGDLTDPYPVLRLMHRDRLGSVVTITDESGGVEARGYDPFGKPRDGDWAEKTPPVIGSAVTDRGFTDHEHLDESELIHMNGRAYDYHLGRFLSVDPIVQAPGNSQSLNPYSYIMNNPLSGTDPSGYEACGETVKERDVCQIEMTESISRPGSRMMDSVTTTWTVAHNGAQIFATPGANREAFDRLEAAMIGDLSSREDGPGMSAVPMKIGEREANPGFCAESGLRCKDQAQTRLGSSSFPGVSRARHFQEANENLLRAMEADAAYAQMLRQGGINLQRTATGLAPRTPPSGWTWHHAPESGVMQLVPRSQHTPGSVFWDALHPGGRGGYSIWGQ